MNTSNSLRARVNASPRLKNFLILGFLSIIWGSSFILIKKSLEVYAPLQVALLRQSFSASAFLPFLLYHWRKVDVKRLHFYLLIGLCGSAIPSFLFAFAQQHISSSVAGILNSLVPLFTLLLGLIIFQAKFIGSKLIGVLLGLAGASVLIFAGDGQGLKGDIFYSFLIVLATICYAINANLVASVFRDLTSLEISMVGFTMVGVPSFIYLASGTNFFQVMYMHPQAWEALGYVAFLALIGTVLATIIYFKLIQQTNPVFASTTAYLMPLVSVIWGVLDGEAVGWQHLLGMVLILGGVYLSRK
ncbi:MAG: DMT family transporter [Saprospiraceae bacterium]